MTRALKEALKAEIRGQINAQRRAREAAAVEVMNLSIGQKKTYTLEPAKAVMAAYAQDQGDFNTWDYDKRYANMVKVGKLTVTCGDWSAYQDGRRLTC